jgi:hypothetical protein
MTWTSDHKNQQKKFGGSGITPSYFPALMNTAIFGHFSLIQRQGIEQTTKLLFILKVLRWSNVQQSDAKNDFYTPSIYKTIHQKVILTLVKDLDKPIVGPVHLQLFRPSVIRGPCLNETILLTVSELVWPRPPFGKAGGPVVNCNCNR